jgi:Na+-driven multidrug efflux pump
LALPTVLAMLAQSAVNEVDIIFFAWLGCPDSSYAQAALLPCLLLLWMFGGSLSAISVGTQALAARRFAQGRNLDAGAVLANSWVFSLGAGIAFTLVGYLGWFRGRARRAQHSVWCRCTHSWRLPLDY